MRTPRPQQHRSSPRAARGASAALAVAALCGAALTLRPPRAAQAKQCSNPCQVADGALCASLYAAAGGVLPEQVLPQGQPARLRLGRQSGACGGLVPLPKDELAQVKLLSAATPQGPASVTPTTVDGDALRFTAAAPGPLFLRAARDGEDPRLAATLVALVESTAPEAQRPEVRLQLKLPKGLSAARSQVTLRYLPPAAAQAEGAGFPRRAWPTFRQNAAPGLSERPLRLPRGDYEVEWAYKDGRTPRSALIPIQITGPGVIPVTVPASTPAR